MHKLASQILAFLMAATISSLMLGHTVA